jgi:hypothetical protein
MMESIIQKRLLSLFYPATAAATATATATVPGFAFCYLILFTFHFPLFTLNFEHHLTKKEGSLFAETSL